MSQPQMGGQQGLDFNSIATFLQNNGSMTPEQIRSEIEKVASERGISADEFKNVLSQAASIANMLGLN